jgi:hypothetical protein
VTDPVHCPYAKDRACVRKAEHGEECELFKCAACRAVKPACAGGDSDEYDARGELCTDCWWQRKCRAMKRRRARKESAA